QWFKMHGVRLPNGDNGEEGDGVGVVTKWTPPDEFAKIGVAVDTLKAVQTEAERAFKAGTPYRASPKSKNEPWIGEVIGAETALDHKDKDDQKKISRIQAEWVRSGALIVDKEWRDEGRRKRPIVRSGPPA